jgi:hypothetical protein
MAYWPFADSDVEEWKRQYLSHLHLQPLSNVSLYLQRSISPRLFPPKRFIIGDGLVSTKTVPRSSVYSDSYYCYQCHFKGLFRVVVYSVFEVGAEIPLSFDSDSDSFIGMMAFSTVVHKIQDPAPLRSSAKNGMGQRSCSICCSHLSLYTRERI